MNRVLFFRREATKGWCNYHVTASINKYSAGLDVHIYMY
jgi:hypothetical protein